MADGAWGPGNSTRIFRVTIKFDRGPVHCMTGFHLRDVGLTNLEADDVVAAVTPWATTKFNTTLQASDRVTAVDAVDIVAKLGHEQTFTTIVGVQPGEGAPSFITVPVSLKSAQRTRYGQGRMLWPVGSEAAMLGNVLNPGTVPQYQDALDDLMTNFTGSALTHDLHLVNVHGAIPPRPNHPALEPHWYDVTSARLNVTLGSLRRRKLGVGQ